LAEGEKLQGPSPENPQIKNVEKVRTAKAVFEFGLSIKIEFTMGIWQGVAMDSLKFRPTLLCPAGGPPLKRPYGCLSGGLPAEWVACGHLYPFGYPMPYAYAVQQSLGIRLVSFHKNVDSDLRDGSIPWAT
jgi:hypothetical protein